MRQVLVSAIIAYSLALTGCASVTVERVASWEPVESSANALPDHAAGKVGVDVVRAAVEAYNDQKATTISLTATPSKETKDLVDRMTKVSTSLDALATTLNSDDASGRSKSVFNRDSVDSTLDIVSLYQSGDLDLYAAMGYNLIAKLKNEPSFLSDTNKQVELLAEAQRRFPKARFAGVYLKAYFRGGRFAFAELKAEDISNKVSADVEQRLKHDIDYDHLDTAAKKLADRLIEQTKTSISDGVSSVCRTHTDGQCLLTNALGEMAFITKGGRSIQFSGVGLIVGAGGKASLSVEKPASTEVSAQLAEVLTEALWDAGLAREVPASSKSTACAAELLDKSKCLDETAFDEHIQKVYERGDRAAAYVTSIASQLIRGHWVLALNNEALAKAIETSAGSNARKAAERWYYLRNEWIAQSEIAAKTDELKSKAADPNNSMYLSFSVN